MGFAGQGDAFNEPESLYALGCKNHGVGVNFAGYIKDETGRENVVDEAYSKVDTHPTPTN